MQVDGMQLLRIIGHEDCLYANVYTPQVRNFVWLEYLRRHISMDDFSFRQHDEPRKLQVYQF